MVYPHSDGFREGTTAPAPHGIDHWWGINDTHTSLSGDGDLRHTVSPAEEGGLTETAAADTAAQSGDVWRALAKVVGVWLPGGKVRGRFVNALCVRMERIGGEGFSREQFEEVVEATTVEEGVRVAALAEKWEVDDGAV